jgi:hypothetical protein
MGADSSAGEAEVQEIALAIAKDGRRSFAWGFAGFVMMMIGGCMTVGAPEWSPIWATTIGFGLYTAGTALLVVGLAFYSRKKGQSILLGGLGVLSWFGIIVLALMPKLCGQCYARVGSRVTTCGDCGAPA